MHGQAYLRKGIITRLNTTLEDYLWLTAQVPEDRLDAVPPGAAGSVRAALLDLAVDLDTRAYPLLIALVEGQESPPPSPAEVVARRRTAWEDADLMIAMKQIRYRFQATESLLTDTLDAGWGTASGAPTPLALAAFALWRQLLVRLDALATLVAALYAL
ncbi:MAG: hypothetical protein M3Z04_05670 [Chloroflexota bacterium]|nr:hypothetical protein [Chloroflexota bacterium]